MATRSAILNENRNPGMTQDEAEDIFSQYLGVKNFIWLDGVPGLEITDMHIDGFARFYDSETIVTLSEEDLEEWSVPSHDIDTLYEAQNVKGKEYEIVTVPLTKNNVVTAYGKDLGYK
jgi:agmatine deiminase